MPRTLPAALTTVMDAGIFEPYIRVVIATEPNETLSDTIQPLSYRLEALKAIVTVAQADIINSDLSYFRIVRGAVISGSPVTISSIQFKTIGASNDGRFTTLTGEPLDRAYQSIAANSTYEDVIETALTFSDRTLLPSYEGAAAWKAYKFYPAGKNIVLSPRKKLFTLLQQKYLIFATENGFDGTDNNMFFFVATDTRATDYNFTDALFNKSYQEENRLLLWRDEANSVHTNGTATNIIHNLGYLETTATNPPNVTNNDVGSKSTKLPVHLKYRTGDKAHTDALTVNNYTGRINVIEVFDPKSTPSWYMIIEQLIWFNATEGGALPSTIEAAAPYTPLATGNFDGVLSANENNVQAAFEKLDDVLTNVENYLIDNNYVYSLGNATENGNLPIWAGSDLPAIQDSFINIADILAGWKEIGATWTYASADDPVYQIYVTGNVTADADYKLGNKIRCTVNSVVVYGFIVKVGGYDAGNNRTPIDIYMGADYDLTNHTITNKFISKVKSPDGFPASPDKWTFSLSDTGDRRQTPPTGNVWYNLGTLSLAIPICVWDGYYELALEIDATLAAAGNRGFRSTLSTANNTESNTAYTATYTFPFPVITNGIARATVHREVDITLTTKTTHYLNGLVGIATNYIAFRGDVIATTLKLVCAYL